MATLTLRVRGTSDVERVRRAVREIAVAAGLGPVGAESVVLAAIELATNLVRYATRGGELRIDQIDGARKGVQLESRDEGPGIADLDAARRDGVTTSTRPTLGAGLGSIERLMDESEFSTGPAGTRIVARKWVDLR